MTGQHGMVADRTRRDMLRFGKPNPNISSPALASPLFLLLLAPFLCACSCGDRNIPFTGNSPTKKRRAQPGIDMQHTNSVVDREKTQIQTTKNPRTEKHKCKKKNTMDEAQGREGAEGGREGESDPHDTRPVQDIYCRYIHIIVIMKMQSRPQRLLLPLLV